MEVAGLEAVYYPRSYIADSRSLASYSLFFERVHLIHPGDISLTGNAADPTAYLKGLPDNIEVLKFGADRGKGSRVEFSEYTNHFRFALNNRELLGDVIWYHPHLLAQEMAGITSALLSGRGLQLEDLVALFSGQSGERRAFDKFKNEHPEIANEFTLRVVPSAVELSKKHDWCLVGDDSAMPVPEISRVSTSVRQLTAVLADECIRIALPRCSEIEAAAVLEARDKLGDLLIPFRMSMQRLTKQLRASLGADAQLDDVWQEARFIAESEVQPAVHDLVRRVQNERQRLFSRLFGKAISWIPFLAKAFVMPSADSVYRALEKAYGDMGSVVGDEDERAVSREPGLSYLLGVSEHL